MGGGLYLECCVVFCLLEAGGLYLEYLVQLLT